MRYSTSLRVLLLAITTGALWLAYTQRGPGLAMEQVRDNLHVIIGSGGNVGVLVTDDGVVLIDDKFERNVPDILAKVKSVTNKSLAYVINTHHHGDHSGGNAKLLAQAPVIAHDNARANILRNDQPGAQPITFSSELSLHLGDDEVRTIHFGRGHTNGDSVVYFPKLRSIHTGDLFPSGAPFIDYNNGGSSVEWDTTLEKILELDFDTVIPGHGPVTNRATLIQWRENYAEVRTRVRELSKAGMGPEEALQKLKLDDIEGWEASRLLTRSMPGMLHELK